MYQKLKTINKNLGGELEIYICDFLKLLDNKGFSKGVIERYNRYLKRFNDFCNKNNFNDFTSNTAYDIFLKSIKDKPKYSINFFYTVLNKFRDFILTGDFKIMYIRNSCCLKSKKLTSYLSLFDLFMQQSELKDSTRLFYCNVLKNFFLYLEKNKIYSLENLSSDYIFKYINSSKLAHSSKYNQARTLKKFFNFTFGKNTTVS